MRLTLLCDPPLLSDHVALDPRWTLQVSPVTGLSLCLLHVSLWDSADQFSQAIWTSVLLSSNALPTQQSVFKIIQYLYFYLLVVTPQILTIALETKPRDPLQTHPEAPVPDLLHPDYKTHILALKPP